MFNEPELFWKNFRLGTELQISGTFIYNALYFLDKMEHFYYEDECFEFLYNTSVGLERIEKIALILLEHNKEFDQEQFEKSLKIHNHSELMRRIRTHKKIVLEKRHNKFIQILSDFYNSTRYARFNLSSVYKKSQEKELLVGFVEGELKIKINCDSMFPTEIDRRMRNLIGETISTIANKLYDIIQERARELGIYTYEIAADSKAYKIFMNKEYTFEKEKLLKKEILLNLLTIERNDGFMKFIKTLEPIEFDSGNTNEYVKVLLDTHKKNQWTDELDYIYEENEFNEDRLQNINAIGSEAIFDEDDDEDIF